MQRSQSLHYPWLKASATEEDFDRYIKKYQQENCFSYLVCYENDLLGVINISQIVRDSFQSAFLSFYAAMIF